LASLSIVWAVTIFSLAQSPSSSRRIAASVALYHAPLRSDHVKWRLAKQCAPAISDGAPQGYIPPYAAAGRIVRRSDYVRQIEKTPSHLEPTGFIGSPDRDSAFQNNVDAAIINRRVA
jgi:hypothetical protein